MARGWHLVRRPAGLPEIGDFALRDLPERPLADGELRVRNRWLSVDPYMRGRMNDAKSYAEPFALDAPMDGGAVGEVTQSRAEGFAPGDTVLHMAGWRDEAVVPAKTAQKLPATGLPDELFLSTLGLTGMTAWFGLLDVAQAKAGDIVFVSAAGGAVGSAAVQIAKAKGMTVIGSAGGPEKCALVRDLGADAVIDYRAQPIRKGLAQAAPDGIDVYFDNVGGDHLDAALGLARMNARFAICGMIAGYNDPGPVALKNLMRIIVSRVRIEGFLLLDFYDRTAEFLAGMIPLVQGGQVKTEHTVRDGLEATPGAFLELFSGGNTGKMLVRL